MSGSSMKGSFATIRLPTDTEHYKTPHFSAVFLFPGGRLDARLKRFYSTRRRAMFMLTNAAMNCSLIIVLFLIHNKSKYLVLHELRFENRGGVSSLTIRSRMRETLQRNVNMAASSSRTLKL